VTGEEMPARQSPVAHHQILHALSRPSAIALSRDALAREPLCYLAVTVADLSDRGLDVGRVRDGIIIGQIGDPSSTQAR
jgi:hypothetical protein